MSFDSELFINLGIEIVSIPFDQGNVFRLVSLGSSIGDGTVSIPFDQGNVFRQYEI